MSKVVVRGVILFISFIALFDAKTALANSVYPELLISTENLVIKLNKTLKLSPQQQLRQVKRLSKEAESIFAQYQKEGASTREQYSIQHCLMFVAVKQKELIQKRNTVIIKTTRLN